MKSALAGDAEAQFKVAVCCGCGYGVSQDYVKAVRWYRLSAEQNQVMAQFRLGQCYRKGLGVSPNPVEAVRWYRRTAIDGLTEGQIA